VNELQSSCHGEDDSSILLQGKVKLDADMNGKGHSNAAVQGHPETEHHAENHHTEHQIEPNHHYDLHKASNSAIDAKSALDWSGGAMIGLLVCVFILTIRDLWHWLSKGKKSNFRSGTISLPTTPNMTPSMTPRTPREAQTLGREMLGALVTTVNNLLTAVGIVSILFVTTPGLSKHIGIGLKHAIFGHMVGQGITAALSGYSTPMGSPCFEVVPFMKVILLDTAKHCGGDSICEVATVITAGTFLNVLSGIIMYIAGYFHLSVLLRFFPDSLKVGMHAGIGIICLALGIELCCGENFLEMHHASPLTLITEHHILFLWLPGLVCAVGLYLFQRYVIDSAFTIPMFFLCGVLGFQVVMHSLDWTTKEAQKNGWLYADIETASFYELWTLNIIGNVKWHCIWTNMPILLAAAMTGPFLNNVGDLMMTDSIFGHELGKSKFDYEVKVQGWSHILSGLSQGFPSDFKNEHTELHRLAGGRRKMSVFFNIFFLSIIFFASSHAFPIVPYLLSVLPKVLTGALMLLAAIGMIMESLVGHYEVLPRLEYAVVWAVVIATIWSHGEIEIALLAGLALSFAVFVFDTSRGIPVMFDQERSNTFWPVEFEAMLSDRSDGIHVAHVYGHVFFANAEKVVNEMLRRSKGWKAIVIDFNGIESIDHTGVNQLGRLCDGCAERKLSVIFAGLNSKQIELFILQGVIKYGNDVAEIVIGARSYGSLMSKKDVFQLFQDLQLENDLCSPDAVWAQMMPDDDHKVYKYELCYVVQRIMNERAEKCTPREEKPNIVADTVDEEDEEEPECDLRVTSTLDRALQLAEQVQLNSMLESMPAYTVLATERTKASLNEKAKTIVGAKCKDEEVKALLLGLLSSTKAGGPTVREYDDEQLVETGESIWLLLEGTVELYVRLSRAAVATPALQRQATIAGFQPKSKDSDGSCRRIFSVKYFLALLEPITHVLLTNHLEHQYYEVRGSALLLEFPMAWLSGLRTSGDANLAAAMYKFIYEGSGVTCSQVVHSITEMMMRRQIMEQHKEQAMKHHSIKLPAVSRLSRAVQSITPRLT
jgi:MFS superfamily sulfate permease-like transporter